MHGVCLWRGRTGIEGHKEDVLLMIYNNGGSTGNRMNQEFMIGLRVFRHTIFPPLICISRLYNTTEAIKAENTYIKSFVNIILELFPCCLNFYV